MELSDGDAGHLMTIEEKAFQPVGLLYMGIFYDLVERGLAHSSFNGFTISQKGRAQLALWRETHEVNR